MSKGKDLPGVPDLEALTDPGRETLPARILVVPGLNRLERSPAALAAISKTIELVFREKRLARREGDVS